MSNNFYHVAIGEMTKRGFFKKLREYMCQTPLERNDLLEKMKERYLPLAVEVYTPERVFFDVNEDESKEIKILEKKISNLESNNNQYKTELHEYKTASNGARKKLQSRLNAGKENIKSQVDSFYECRERFLESRNSLKKLISSIEVSRRPFLTIEEVNDLYLVGNKEAGFSVKYDLTVYFDPKERAKKPFSCYQEIETVEDSE